MHGTTGGYNIVMGFIKNRGGTHTCGEVFAGMFGETAAVSSWESSLQEVERRETVRPANGTLFYDNRTTGQVAEA